MPDVAGKCINANESVSGRAITRVPNSRIFKIEPKINRQASSGVLENKYTNRFDEPRYYSGDTAS